MTDKRHSPNRTVRDYLLEFASAAEMVSFEERYFTDPEFLKLVENEEERLIEDYLLGHLEGESESRFKRIYEDNSNLALKVDTARKRLFVKTNLPSHQKRFWTYAWTTIGALACIAVAGFFLYQKPPAKQPLAQLEMPAQAPFYDVRLSPGTSKGAGQASDGATLVPSEKNRFRFIFELPGVKGPVKCMVKLLRIEGNGKTTEVTSSGIAWSHTGPNTEAEFSFDGLSLSKADYLAELTTPDGAILNRYLFQAQ